MSDPKEPALWPVGWAGAAACDLDASLRATPAQRLEWLAEAQIFVWSVGAWPEWPRAIAPPAPGSKASAARSKAGGEVEHVGKRARPRR